MRRLVSSLLLASLALLLIVAPVLAYTYYATLTILEANGTPYTMLAVAVASPNQWMADNGFMETDALDTRVQTLGGALRPHLVSHDKILTASIVPASSQTNLLFTTGDTDLASMDIITGYGGYLTTVDANHAAMEPGDDFELELDGYVDTSVAGNDQNLIAKGCSAFQLLVSNVEELTAVIYGAGIDASDVLIPDAAGDYTALALVGAATNWEAVLTNDGDTSYVHVTGTDVPQAKDAYNLQAPAPPAVSAIVSVQVTWLGKSSTTNLGKAQPFLRLSGAETAGTKIIENNTAGYGGHSEVLARPGGGCWAWEDIADLQVCLGLETYNGVAGWTRCTQIYVTINYNTGDAVVAAVNVPSGEHKVNVTATGGGTNLLVISVDDAVAGDFYDSVALAGATVADTAGDWTFGQNNVLPYYDYYRHTVGGVLIAHYQPIDMIHGEAYAVGTVTVTNGDATVEGAGGMAWDDGMVGSLFVSADTVQYVVASVTDADTLELATVYGGGTLGAQAYNMYPRMPDREGAAQDSRITWGTNPAGVTVALGGMTSSSQPAAGTEVEESTQDVMPAIEVSDWFVEPDVGVGGALLTNPLRPFVTIMSYSTNITELQAWRILALAFILFVTVSTAKAVRSHLFLSGVAAAAAIGACVAMTIFPMWALVFAIGTIIGGLVAERSPSL